MSDGQDGILGHLARLHPGWMAVPVACVVVPSLVPVFLAAGNPEYAGAASLVAFLLIATVAFGHMLLVIAQTSGRFYSRRRRRLIGPAAAALAMLAAPAGGFALSGTPVDQDALIYGMLTLFFLAALYLQIRASVALVESERGFGGGTGQKVGTYLLFSFWIVGVFFIQARIRKLARRFSAGKAVALPMEKLELLELKQGSPALVLTGRVGPEDFAAYAEEFIGRLDGHIRDKADLPAGPRWDVEIEGSDFWLFFARAESRVVLEARGDADLLLPRLRKWLTPVAGT